LAQLLQGHILQLDVAGLLGGVEWQRTVFGAALGGGRLSSTLAERGGRHAQDLRTRLTVEADGPVLSGRKHYATGAATAAWVAVSALDDDGRVVYALIRTDDPGVSVDHEWHAMGQRATVSGTLELDRVRVRPGLVMPVWRAFERPQSFGARAQLVHAAIAVGIARGALDAAVRFTRDCARPFSEAHAAGWAPTAAEDPQIVRRAGRLVTRVNAAEQMLAWAARELDVIGGWPVDDQEAARASLAVAQAKAYGGEVAVKVANELFAMGGTGSTDRRLGLDRHWRNARTHSVHDPADWKYHHIGAHLLTGAMPPNHGQI
jgi:alkylation response protein AidB-like acyl-CoA dehydrogenase